MAAKFYKKSTKNVKYASTMVTAMELLGEGVEKEVMRPSAYAGVRVLYDLLKILTPENKGVLKGAVYHYYNDRLSRSERGKFYSVGINMKDAPHWHLVEYGHSMPFTIYRTGAGQWRTRKERHPNPGYTPAYPFIRPAWLTGREPAISRMRMEAKERMKKLVKEVGNQTAAIA